MRVRRTELSGTANARPERGAHRCFEDNQSSVGRHHDHRREQAERAVRLSEARQEDERKRQGQEKLHQHERPRELRCDGRGVSACLRSRRRRRAIRPGVADRVCRRRARVSTSRTGRRATPGGEQRKRREGHEEKRADGQLEHGAPSIKKHSPAGRAEPCARAARSGVAPCPFEAVTGVPRSRFAPTRRGSRAPRCSPSCTRRPARHRAA